MKRDVRLALFLSAVHEDDLSLMRVSLTFADSELALWSSAHDRDLKLSWAWQCGDLFAHAIASEAQGGTGALLSLDLKPGNLRPHWYGLVLSRRRPVEVDQLWNKLGRHWPDPETFGKRVTVISGSTSRPWDRVLDRRPVHPVVANINGTINYAAKALPRDAPRLSLPDRLIRTGVFERPAADPSARLCPICKVHLLTDRQLTCSAACRKAKERAALRAA